MRTNKTTLKELRARRRADGFTSQGLPRGYRENPSLLNTLPDVPRRGLSRRNPANWVLKECLYCGARAFLKGRIFCSVHCRRSYEFRQKHPLLAVQKDSHYLYGP